MIKLQDNNWTGKLILGCSIIGYGKVHGYSWYLSIKTKSWLVEISEDQNIEATELPLVGFGCSGWLYESAETIPLTNNNTLALDINEKLSKVFLMFEQKRLPYLPAIACPCSE